MRTNMRNIDEGSRWGKQMRTKKMREIKSTPKEIAFKVGEVMGDRISEKNIKQKISFDRGPYLYHGRVEELAKGVRSKGIKF